MWQWPHPPTLFFYFDGFPFTHTLYIFCISTNRTKYDAKKLMLQSSIAASSTETYLSWFPDRFPDCPEPIEVYWVITVEGDCHLVSWADDGTRHVGPTIFLRNRSEGDENKVISTGGFGLYSKTLEGEQDLLSWGDFQVPGLTMKGNSCRNLAIFVLIETDWLPRPGWEDTHWDSLQTGSLLIIYSLLFE